MIHIGTSGYSFRDWIGPFYPPGTRSTDMLRHYARRFGTVEINATYYRLPPPATFAQMAERTPPDFRFTVKLPKEITHDRTLELGTYDAFLRAIAPLDAAGKFHGALAQFPFAFRASSENRDFLHILRLGLGRIPLFVEFRHDSWAGEETFALLDDIDAGFCSVDEPKLRGLFPPLVRSVGSVAYFRFHGRNGARWWSGDNSTRYDYLYDEQELEEWATKIRTLAERTRETYVFFNNCHAGAAARNALRMQELLELVPHE